MLLCSLFLCLFAWIILLPCCWNVLHILIWNTLKIEICFQPGSSRLSETQHKCPSLTSAAQAWSGRPSAPSSGEHSDLWLSCSWLCPSWAWSSPGPRPWESACSSHYDAGGAGCCFSGRPGWRRVPLSCSETETVRQRDTEFLNKVHCALCLDCIIVADVLWLYWLTADCWAWAEAQKRTASSSDIVCLHWPHSSVLFLLNGPTKESKLTQKTFLNINWEIKKYIF